MSTRTIDAGWRDTATQRLLVATGVGLIVAVAIRLPLLSTPGLPGDLGQFVEWVNQIAINGLPKAYDGDMSFGPVIAYVWGLLAFLQPAFQSVADSSDPGLNVLMKMPATAADFAVAAGIAFALRDRPARDAQRRARSISGTSAGLAKTSAGSDGRTGAP